MENHAPTPNATNATLRITSKALKHPDSGQLLRANFEPIDCYAAIPTDLATGNGKLDKVLAALWLDAVKLEAQKAERAAWIAGAAPFNPTDSAQVTEYFQGLVNGVTVDSLHTTYCTERTRAARQASYTSKIWKEWISKVFVKALNLWYASEGKSILDGAKLAATISLMGQGRNMAEHNKAAFIARFQSLLESDNAEVLELVTSDESSAAFDWLTQPTKASTAEELEI